VKVGASYDIMVEDIKKKGEAKKERKEIKRTKQAERKMELLNMKEDSKNKIHEMKKQNPNKTLIPLPTDNNNKCNECNYMRMNTLEKLYQCLLNETNEIIVDENISKKAIKSINRMLEMSK
jgi:quinolinate synthase